MANMILEFLGNLLKIGKEQFFLKSTFLRDKVPIKPVLGLTGLGVLFVAVRPLLSSRDAPEQQSKSTAPLNDKPDPKDQYTIQKTLYLMREKEKMLKRKEDALQEKS